MQDDINYLDKCITILDEGKNVEEINKIHKDLKMYTPAGMDETDCDIVWAKAWRSCPPEQVENPDFNRIRQCDILFCKMLLKKISL